ncbi:tRNA (adenosine(37)-N6)-threonylcarbamoyltransferase complex ATPase subunit type 1 TsaE [Candidatus Uhrbacteria bacterium RIFCSPHIGHO2_02_FULL_60_10]|uniref:tRNA threonylcarbamoyladenosine biosynthesis protein TsaE n=1 Tax=Candidatus Uhrbacteria bacterium RIFCSPHIGHO2_02_FULL_60_10 TaxID=1802392 RepID=A0A1F7U611_9BACT|nr:MAG: tRNA (adenosine(37)-N6)-threonylcarbamoyltransferase complex ATPase subunit type 1 TsaE [Candidatus Uhrbacteria bacterium RIFCSPHIGHO2_02_FULL_60_10]
MPSKKLKNLAALNAFAKEYATTLKGGEIIGLVGELGAGKTAFVQRLAAALRVPRGVRSPTFVLMNVFSIPPRRGSRLHQLCHIDAYRLKDESELRGLGFEDYAGAPDTVTIVEWVDRVPAAKESPHYRELKFSYVPEGGRKVQF